jgi:hypothetical protein
MSSTATAVMRSLNDMSALNTALMSFLSRLVKDSVIGSIDDSQVVVVRVKGRSRSTDLFLQRRFSFQQETLRLLRVSPDAYRTFGFRLMATLWVPRGERYGRKISRSNLLRSRLTGNHRDPALTS